MVKRWVLFLATWAVEAAIFYGFARVNFMATQRGRTAFDIYFVAVLLFNAFIVSPYRKKPLA